MALTPIHGRVGPVADRPAVGTRRGVRYTATDEGIEYEWTGATWVTVDDAASNDLISVATQAELDAHTSDPTAAHDASAISFTPAGTIAATDVQAAIEELDTALTALDTEVTNAWPAAVNLTTNPSFTEGARHVAANGAGTITVTVPEDAELDILMVQDATGGRAVTFSGVDVWATQAGSAPDTSARAANAADRFAFETINGTTYGYWLTETISGGGSVATDAIFDAKGDLAVGTGANTAARLAVGSNDKVLVAASGETTGLKWGSVPDPIRLPIPGGSAPDGTGAGNNPATLERNVSSGVQTANTPKVAYSQLLFDQATDEHWLWQFRIPQNYGSGGSVKLTWGAKVTAGNVVWKAGIVAADPGVDNMSTSVFVAADAAAAAAVPGTVGQVTETTVTLTMTDVSAGDLVVLFVGRDADAGTDTAAGDATLVAAEFLYTAA